MEPELSRRIMISLVQVAASMNHVLMRQSKRSVLSVGHDFAEINYYVTRERSMEAIDIISDRRSIC